MQVNTYDLRGGAELVSWNLFQAYRQRGYPSYLAVGYRRTTDPDVFLIPNPVAGGWPGFWWHISYRLRAGVGKVRGIGRLVNLARDLADPRRWLDTLQGREIFRYPGSRLLLSQTPSPVNILHFHNLHGDYFDLRTLPYLSHRVPTFLTLHDAWLLSGHCAHSFDCDRWLVGCGHCPDLTIYPAVRRDDTAANFRRKAQLYAASRLYLATPCQWLLERVTRSMLQAGIVEARVIPNGVDQQVFAPGDRQAARQRLNIPAEAQVLLFSANTVKKNIYKDYATMRAAVVRVATANIPGPVLFIALGEELPPERQGNAELRFVPFQRDPAILAAYYQAADLYVHAAHIDTFPTSILEALACGTPVIATAVGGIPEQVKSLDLETLRTASGAELDALDSDASGVLTPAADPEAMALAIIRLLGADALRARLSANAAADARKRFDLNRQTDRYLEWYHQVQQNH
jgi:glycosyltransferase involved in cell wall biosynthesis